MIKKTTLNELGSMMEHVVKHMATKEDISDIKQTMATKEQIIALHMQVNSIETEIRGMKRLKIESRVADLEASVERKRSPSAFSKRVSAISFTGSAK